MKLAFCLFKYFPYGGLQRDFLRIAKECLARKHEVHVYAMEWRGDSLPGMTVHLLQVKGMRNHTRCVRFAKVLQKKLAENSYDLVIGFNKLPALDIYYAADVCFKARAQTKHFLYRLQSRYKRFVALEEAVFAKNHHTEIFMISPLQQKEYAACYQTNATRFHLLPPGIAKDRIAPDNAAQIRAEMRTKLKLQEDEWLLLMIGSGFKTKGVERSIHALSNLPENLKTKCRLFVIGEDCAKPLIKLAKKLDVAESIHFLGGRDDVPQFLLAADLLLHPSLHENTGTVLLEAVVSGLPVLTVDVCGYAHYIQQAKAGIVLSSPFSVEVMTQTLVQMLQSNELTKWRESALTFGKNADIYSMPQRAVNLIDSIGQKRHALCK